jgi:5-methyltetrahydrofolate--homocysteine methyltransferase
MLQERIVIFDGALGTNLQAMNLEPEDFGGKRYTGCIDHLVLSKPATVETVHRSFLEAGVDVIETDTFRTNRLTLVEFGLGDQVGEIKRPAASLARRLADEYSATGSAMAT